VVFWSILEYFRRAAPQILSINTVRLTKRPLISVLSICITYQVDVLYSGAEPGVLFGVVLGGILEYFRVFWRKLAPPLIRARCDSSRPGNILTSAFKKIKKFEKLTGLLVYNVLLCELVRLCTDIYLTSQVMFMFMYLISRK
jgi:hypothetical protein